MAMGVDDLADATSTLTSTIESSTGGSRRGRKWCRRACMGELRRWCLGPISVDATFDYQ